MLRELGYSILGGISIASLIVLVPIGTRVVVNLLEDISDILDDLGL